MTFCLQVVLELSATSNVNHADSTRGDTALMLACNNGHLNSVKALLTHSSLNIDQKNDDGATATDIAYATGAFDIAQELERSSRRSSRARRASATRGASCARSSCRVAAPCQIEEAPSALSLSAEAHARFSRIRGHRMGIAQCLDRAVHTVRNTVLCSLPVFWALRLASAIASMPWPVRRSGHATAI